VGGANIQIVHYFDQGYLEQEISMIYSLLFLEQNI
jgi:lipopolysaccharide biosynthesis glycosyltransferase